MRARPALPTGLRWRLSASVAAVVLICTAISFLAVYRGTGTQLHHQVDREIAGDLDELARTVSVSDRGPREAAAAARNYMLGQPFSASSTLQFATIMHAGSAAKGPSRSTATPGSGSETIANRPELFGPARPDHGENAVEQTDENGLAQQLLSVRDGYSTLSLADVGDLRLLKRTLTLQDGTRVSVGVGEPLAGVAHAQRGVARAFILAGLLALAGALGASFLIGTRFTLPLRRMAAVAAKVDAGDLHPRIHDVGRSGDEVRVLAETFNRMLDRLTDAFAGQRAFLADASHELRTPLTVIRGQLEVLAAQPDLPAQEVRRVERLVQAEIARIARLVDDLLLLAKAEQTEFLRPEPIDLEPYVHELWDGVSLLAPRRFQLGPVPAGFLTADPDRLAQALRNLIANAIEHTVPEHGLVRLDVQCHGPDRLRFLVSDDGPGIPPAERERVFERFHRTDSARDRVSGGTGLGLAIVRAIAEAHGGRALVADATAGGTRIELELPRFAPGTPNRVKVTEDTGLRNR
ncbi:MAG TPA: HAMP domain-containing sensor histidine kinase [Solirubrobacteraceae bacterium]|jgi:signal transduction histidine kinase|nr:HAMP domain-containing sensor histidine kinase [Solirubrobacteraceae bacterium]